MFYTWVSVHVLCFRGYYTSLCLLISLKLFAFIRSIHWCSHQYNWHHMEPCQGSLQCLQAKGALNILPGKVCVWGYMPHCTKSTPSPFSLHFPLWFNWCNINHQMYTIHYNYNNVSLCQLLQVSGPNGPSSWSAQLNKTTVQPFYNHQYVVELLEVRRHFYYTLEMIKRSNACFMRSCSPLWWATVAQCRSWCI